MRKNAKLNVFVAAILAIAMCLPFMASCSIGFVSDLNVCEVKASGVSVSLEAKNGDGEWVSAAGTFLNFKANEGATRVEWKAGSINALPALRVKNKGTDNVKYTLSVKGVNGDAALADSLVWTVNGEAISTEPAQLRAGTATDEFIFKAQVKDGTADQGLSLDSAAITLVAEKDDSRYPAIDENEFKTALSEGGEITLGENVSIVPVVEDTTVRTLVPQTTIDKDVTLNLNGKKLAPAASAAEANYGEATILLTAVMGGTLTINGDGVIDCEAGENNSYGINVNGGNVVVNGGSFYGALTAIQVQKGSLVINGGFFDLAVSCKAAVPQYAKYIVNCIDKAYKDGTATITIKGGTFVNFDPSADPEGPNTTYVESGYIVTSETKENGDVWYTVVENPYTDATYTPAASDAEISEAVKANEKTVVALSKAGTYNLPDLTGKELHVIGNKNTVIDMANKTNKATEVTFSGVTVNFGTNDYCGFQHTGKLVYENCKITGKQFLYAESVEFINCEFVQDNVDYNVWTYGAGTVTFKGCTFTCKGKSVLIYNEGNGDKKTQTVNFEDCSFVASAKETGKAAIEIDSSLSGPFTVNIDAKTAANVTGFDNGTVSGNPVWNNKKGGNAIVVVDGKTVLSPAA